MRLWVDDQLLIDEWQPQSLTAHWSPPIYLAAGVEYPIVMDYFELGGSAVARLWWLEPETEVATLIPAANLLSDVDCNESGIPDDREPGLANPLTLSDIAGCLTGPDVPASSDCDCLDTNFDGSVSLADVVQLQANFGGTAD